METTTHEVQSVTVTEVSHGDWKTIKIKIVQKVPMWCSKEITYKREPVEHTHTLFTDNLDLTVEFQETEV